MSPILALIITNSIWGASAPIYKFALGNIPPFTFLFVRFFFAALIFYPTVRKEHFSNISRRDWVYIILAIFFGFTLQIGFLVLGLQKTQSINSSIILIGTPILLFFLSIIFLHEKFKLKLLLGMLVSSLGVLFILFSPLLMGINAHPSIGEFQGNMLYIGALVADVVSILLFKKVSTKVPVFTLAFLSFAIGALSFFPLMLPELRSWSFFSLNSHGVFGLFYAIFFASVIAYYLYFYGLQKLSGEEVGIFGYLNPIFTVLVALPLLGEVPSLYFIIGAVFITLGLIISEFKLHSHHIPHK